MCGRYTLRTPANLMITQFALKFQGALVPRYNIAPTQEVPVIRGEEREMSLLRWGLVPFWSKSPNSGSRMINARSESAATKPAFRTALKSQRCLVPADGYIEWRKEGKQKQPYWVRRKDEQPFLMAGLWDSWRDKSANSDSRQRLETFTILTTDANALTSEVHDRMPVILAANDHPLWLDSTVDSNEQLQHLFEPFDDDQLKMEPISTRVNSVKNDDASCVEIVRLLF